MYASQRSLSTKMEIQVAYDHVDIVYNHVFCCTESFIENSYAN